MAKLSNILITCLNTLTTFLSLVAISIYIYLHLINSSPTHCQRAIERPILLVGLALLVVSILGLVGSGCRITILLWAYLVVLVFLIIGWLVFSVFVLFVTNKGAGRVVSGLGFKEYRLGDYSHWLQKHVVNEKNWIEIRACLVDSNVCHSFHHLVLEKNSAHFLKDKFTPIQGSCCKPPASCGFTPINATNWAPPKGGPASLSDDPDCKTWNNNQKQLCFDCKSCKAGVLANLRKEWRAFSIVNAIVLVLLLFIYMVACCAVHNNSLFYKNDHP